MKLARPIVPGDSDLMGFLFSSLQAEPRIGSASALQYCDPNDQCACRCG
jgi:hypothetical protein